MAYSKANKKKTELRKWNCLRYIVWIIVLLLCAAVLVTAFCWLLVDSDGLTADRKDEEKRITPRIVSNNTLPKPVRSHIVEPPIQIIEEADSIVDLPLIDLKNWYAIRYDYNVTQVKKEGLFNDLVYIAEPAKLLTKHIHALKDYLATEYVLFYWIPYPDGITCSVRNVRDFPDNIQVDLEIKDQTVKKKVEDYYASRAQVSGKVVYFEFSRVYFSIIFSRTHPQYVQMRDLNKGDYVTSKDWGNLFVINKALMGISTSMRAYSTLEKFSLFDVNFGILKVVQNESKLIMDAISK